MEPTREGFLIVWDSGEGELEHLRDGELVLKHLKGLRDPEGVRAALDEIVTAITESR